MKLKLDGLEEATQRLRALSGAMSDDKIESLLMVEGGIPLKEEVQFRAPMKTGQLTRAIIAKPGRRAQHNPSVLVAVDFKQIKGRDFDQKMNRYPYIVEYGAKPHEIKPKRGKFLKLFGRVLVRSVKHPGFEGRHYFRNALSRMRPVIRLNIEAGLTRLVEQALNRGTGSVKWGAGRSSIMGDE